MLEGDGPGCAAPDDDDEVQGAGTQEDLGFGFGMGGMKGIAAASKCAPYAYESTRALLVMRASKGIGRSNGDGDADKPKAAQMNEHKMLCITEGRALPLPAAPDAMPIHIAADKEFECEEAVRVLLRAYPRGVKEAANVGEVPEAGAAPGTGGTDKAQNDGKQHQHHAPTSSGKWFPLHFAVRRNTGPGVVRLLVSDAVGWAEAATRWVVAEVAVDSNMVVGATAMKPAQPPIGTMASSNAPAPSTGTGAPGAERSATNGAAASVFNNQRRLPTTWRRWVRLIKCLPLHLCVRRARPSAAMVRTLLRCDGGSDAAKITDGDGLLPIHIMCLKHAPDVDVVSWILSLLALHLRNILC